LTWFVHVAATEVQVTMDSDCDSVAVLDGLQLMRFVGDKFRSSPLAHLFQFAAVPFARRVPFPVVAL